VRSVNSIAEEGSDDPWESDLVFTKADLRDVVPHDNDPVVISVVTTGRRVHRVLVDQGSSADVMFWSTFNKLQLSPDLLRPYTGCLYGFAWDQVEVRGYLELRTTFTDGTMSRTESIQYLVVNANSAYNILLGRPALNRLRAVASTRYIKMKFLDLSGRVIVIKSDQEEARKCYENSLKTKRGVIMVMERPPVSDTPMEVEPLEETMPAGETPVEVVPAEETPREAAPLGEAYGEASPMEEVSEEASPMEEGADEATPRREGRISESRVESARDRRPELVENVVERQVGGKIFKLGRLLSQEEQDEVAVVISSSDMPGIEPDFLCHHLTMDTKVRPVRQRRRKFNEERRLVVKEETKKLLSARHIREIQYPEWLANVVLVKKANGKWRMCVDFTDLNKACPKDSYPLPSIDALVDNASGCKMLSFLDAFSGYNQIKMHPRDERKTTFMTETCSYCYKVMPFGLKNAGATYQRLMDRILTPMLGRNVQAYVDDMVVTSQERGRHTADLEELFATIAKYRLKLNPEKCVFGVEAGKFSGFMLTERGIEANPDKCAAIIAMRSPTLVKEVQQLTGRMTALSRFVSAGGDNGHPYFQCLKRNNRFVWIEECETAFLKLKEYLAMPPVLCKPRVGKPLRLYFAVTEWAISSVLVQEQDQVQRPIYFVSKALQGPKTRYEALEKAALAVVFSARRLRHYFHSFTVVVMMDLPIQKVLQKPDVAGRMVRWAVELSEIDIQYEPRGSIKGQVYADFVAEFSPGGAPQEVERDSQWMLLVDGSSNQ